MTPRIVTMMSRLHEEVDDGRINSSFRRYVPPGDTTNIEYRLATMAFLLCELDEMKICTWLGKGFYYTGYGSVVKCFSCGTSADIGTTQAPSQDCHSDGCAFSNQHGSGDRPFETATTILRCIRKGLVDHFVAVRGRQSLVEAFVEEGEGSGTILDEGEDEIDQGLGNDEEVNALPVEIDLGLFRNRHQNAEYQSDGIVEVKAGEANAPVLRVRGR